MHLLFKLYLRFSEPVLFHVWPLHVCVCIYLKLTSLLTDWLYTYQMKIGHQKRSFQTAKCLKTQLFSCGRMKRENFEDVEMIESHA